MRVGWRVVLALALWGGSALAKEVSVTLQDGTELHGELVERKPKDHLIIKLPTGEVRRFEWSEIKQVDEPVARVEVASPSTDKVEVIVVSDRPNVRLEMHRSRAEPGVAFVGGGNVSTFNSRTGTYSSTYVPGTAVPTTNIVETWHPVCNAPCNELVDADQTYRLTGDGVVTSGKFVIDKQPAVRVNATMGSAGERGGAVALIVFGAAHLVATGLLITFGAIMTPGAPGQVALRDVLYVTSGIVAGASLFAFVPAIMMWNHSVSHVELEPATASNDWSAPAPAPRRFSRDAAAAVLGRATDKARADCRTDDGITGQGHLKVTFAPSGEVSNVEMEPPYAGTPTGDCVEKSFRRANVPAFEGEPVTVGKTFTIGE